LELCYIILRLKGRWEKVIYLSFFVDFSYE
jgi:hypothetical protein